jgi:hypothetical protein
VIYQAAKEMRDTKATPAKPTLGQEKIRLRVEAISFLASTDATMWFDHCDLDQRYALGRMGWATHAKKLLADKSIFLSRPRVQMLERGLDELGATE